MFEKKKDFIWNIKENFVDIFTFGTALYFYNCALTAEKLKYNCGPFKLTFYIK